MGTYKLNQYQANYLKYVAAHETLYTRNKDIMEVIKRNLTYQEYAEECEAKENRADALRKLMNWAKDWCKRNSTMKHEDIERLYEVETRDLVYYWYLPTSPQAKLLDITLRTDFSF